MEIITDLSQIDMTQVVSDSVVTCLEVSGILMLSAFIVLAFIFFVRYHAKVMPLFMGMIAYLVFIFAAANGLMMLIPAINSEGTAAISKMIATSVILVAFYMVARLFLAQVLHGHYDNGGDIMLAGLGLGVGDMVIYGFTTILPMMVLATSINQSGLESVLAVENSSPEAILNIYEHTIALLFRVPAEIWIMAAVSMVMELVANVGFMMIYSGVVRKKLPPLWYGVTAAIHFVMLVSFSFDMTGYTSANQALIPFGIKVAAFVLLVVIVFKLNAGPLEHMLNENYVERATKLPKFGNLRKK